MAGLTQQEIAAIAAEVKTLLSAESTSVDQVPTVSSVSGVASLPAIKTEAGKTSVVRVPVALLKGEAFKYSDFTQAQIAELKKPATEAAAKVESVIETSIAASGLAVTVATHPTYIGEDYYVYQWDLQENVYVKTAINVKGAKGDSFKYSDFTSEQLDALVLSVSELVKDGKTPQLSVGAVTTGESGSVASVELVADGEDESGNPKLKINMSIPKGEGLDYTTMTPEEIAGITGPPGKDGIIEAITIQGEGNIVSDVVFNKESNTLEFSKSSGGDGNSNYMIVDSIEDRDALEANEGLLCYVKSQNTEKIIEQGDFVTTIKFDTSITQEQLNQWMDKIIEVQEQTENLPPEDITIEQMSVIYPFVSGDIRSPGSSGFADINFIIMIIPVDSDNTNLSMIAGDISTSPPTEIPIFINGEWVMSEIQVNQTLDTVNHEFAELFNITTGFDQRGTTYIFRNGKWEFFENYIIVDSIKERDSLIKHDGLRCRVERKGIEIGSANQTVYFDTTKTFNDFVPLHDFTLKGSPFNIIVSDDSNFTEADIDIAAPSPCNYILELMYGDCMIEYIAKGEIPNALNYETVICLLHNPDNPVSPEFEYGWKKSSFVFPHEIKYINTNVCNALNISQFISKEYRVSSDKWVESNAVTSNTIASIEAADIDPGKTYGLQSVDGTNFTVVEIPNTPIS